jgi:hypothetical protein
MRVPVRQSMGGRIAAGTIRRFTSLDSASHDGALLEPNLDDPDIRMELWFALRHI